MYQDLFLTICVVALFACSNGEDSASSGTKAKEDNKEIVVVSWGGAGTDAQRAACYEPFAKETGINIKEVTPPSTSQLKAQVDSGNVEWDVVLMDKTQIDLLNKEGDYLEKILYEKMDQDLLDGIPTEAKKDTGIGAYFWGWTLTYRTDAGYETYRLMHEK